MKKLRLGKKQAETLLRFYDKKETWSGQNHWCGIYLSRSRTVDKPWWPSLDSLLAAGYIGIRICKEIYGQRGGKRQYTEVMLTGLGVSALLEHGYIQDERALSKSKGELK